MPRHEQGSFIVPTPDEGEANNGEAEVTEGKRRVAKLRAALEKAPLAPKIIDTTLPGENSRHYQMPLPGVGADIQSNHIAIARRALMESRQTHPDNGE